MANIWLLPRFDAELALRAIDRYGVTHSQSVPTVFVRMLRLPEDVRSRFEGDSLRLAIHAAAPCPPTVKRRMIDWWGDAIVEYYGSSEGAGGTLVSAAEWLRHPGTVGGPIMGRLRIVDDDGTELAAGQPGHIRWADVPPVAYHNDAAKDCCPVRRGRPSRRRRHQLRLRRWISVAVIGVPNAEFGEEVKAVVELVNGVTASDQLADDLVEFCRGQLATYKCARSVDFVTSRPTTPAGKLYKRRVRDDYWRNSRGA